MVNKEFYSTLTQVCVTILAIMVAFYGVLVIYLGQQVHTYQEEIIQNLQQDDVAVRSFAYITRPPISSWENWSIQMEQESNAYMITKEETWENSPVEVLNSTATHIVNNYTQALEWDEEVRDWLESRNVTRFLAHYNLAIFSLNELIHMIYEQFPHPPAEYTLWYVQTFVSSDFPTCETAFLSWAERYSLFYSGVAEIRSKIGHALQGISEAYLDSAKLKSQTLEQLLQENRTDDWLISSYQELIQYDVAMSTYYTSLFESLSNVNSLVSVTVASIQRYHLFYSLAFSYIWIPLVGMAVSGVVIPMIFLGLSDYIDSYKTKWHWWRWSYITITCIVLFVIFTIWSVTILWDQIYHLYFV